MFDYRYCQHCGGGGGNKFSGVSLDVNIVHKVNLINLRYTLMISVIVFFCGYEDNK